MGCWNWVQDFEKAGEYQETLLRIRAAKELHIQPYPNFDGAPAEDIERLLLASSQLDTAQAKRAKEIADNGK